jgi:hypothetical protein
MRAGQNETRGGSSETDVSEFTISPTRAGRSIVDLELPPARVDIRTYAHDVELSSLVSNSSSDLSGSGPNGEALSRGAIGYKHD